MTSTYQIDTGWYAGLISRIEQNNDKSMPENAPDTDLEPDIHSLTLGSSTMNHLCL